MYGFGVLAVLGLKYIMGKNIEEKTGKANTEENRQFRILSALGITFVVAGHLGYGVFDMGGLFPYYSFHVFIFLFVSGYFYKDEAEKNIGRYIWKKCTVLLFPYFLWNLFYGILAQILHKAGFSLGESLSLKTLFLSPFLGGHQFLYNFSAWFVPALFLVEVINVLMRKVLGILHLKREWLIFICSLILGMATIQLAIGGHVWGNYKFPGRILLMFPGFQMGRIYKEKIESHDTLPNGIYFLLVIGVQVLISIFNAGLAFGVVWVTSFANGFVIPYLTVATGIAFWLRIARIMSENPVVSAKLAVVGRNTFSIMMHHIAVFMLIKGIFYLCSCLTPFCAGFNKESFFHDINYIYLAGGTEASKWIYLLAGMGVPVLIKGGLNRVKAFVRKTVGVF